MSTPLSPWGADTPISMPEPLPRDAEVAVDFGGFCFLPSGGIAHNFTSADLDVYTTPPFLPNYPPDGE